MYSDSPKKITPPLLFCDQRIKDASIISSILIQNRGKSEIFKTNASINTKGFSTRKISNQILNEYVLLGIGIWCLVHIRILPPPDLERLQFFHSVLLSTIHRLLRCRLSTKYSRSRLRERIALRPYKRRSRRWLLPSKLNKYFVKLLCKT